MTVSAQVTPGSVPPAAFEEQEAIAGRSLGQLAWMRLRRDKGAMTAMITLIVIIALAVFAPLITRMLHIDPLSFDDKAVSQDGGLPIGPFGGMSLAHPLGVEPGTGRDNLARLLYGARVSLFISFSATIITCTIGVLVGIVAGYRRGWVDGALGRFMDIVLAFPLLLVALSMAPVLTQRLQSMGLSGNGGRVLYLILVISIFGWPYLARIVRGQVLSIREREFVESAVSMGAGTSRILFREILPNLWAPILVYATIVMPSYIALEASLSFLGVGVLPPTPTWGAMLADSVRYFVVDPAFLFFPGALLFIVVFAFNSLGDAVRDALDPRTGRV